MYITHYSFNKQNSLNRITEYNKTDVHNLASKLGQIEGTAYERFKNIEEYYPKRIKTEEWLYKTVQAKAIVPKVKSPWYFVLGESSALQVGFGINAFKQRIELDIINDDDISFTIGDSMGVFNMPEKYKVVYTKSEILYMYYNGFLNNPTEFLYLQNKHKYIEAQLWNDKYFYANDNSLLSNVYNHYTPTLIIFQHIYPQNINIHKNSSH